MPPFRKRFSTDPTLPLRGRVKGFSMESISPVILRVREARAPAAGFSAPEPFGGFVRCASLRSLPPCGARGKPRPASPPRRLTRGQRRTVVDPGRRTRARPRRAPRRGFAPSARTFGAQARPPFCRLAWRQRKTPPSSNSAGFIDGRGVGCWPTFAPLCDNRRVPGGTLRAGQGLPLEGR